MGHLSYLSVVGGAAKEENNSGNLTRILALWQKGDSLVVGEVSLCSSALCIRPAEYHGKS